MASAADTPAALFFTPNTTYTRNLPYRAPELRPEFQCVGVGQHPTKRELRAFGFWRAGSMSPWESSAQGTTSWEAGWVEYGEPGRPADG